MATITRTSDRDREQMRRSALSDRKPGPTTEEQSGGGFPFDALIKRLSDPNDPTNVSFPFLRLMRRDHMIALALHFIMMPIVRAQWYYDCSNAQVAAYADKIVRPIWGRLALTIMRHLWAGYSPAVKVFEVIQPDWIYETIDGEFKKVWDNGNIGCVVYKPVIPLKPESCRPRFKNGNFDGIAYDRRYSDGWFLIHGEEKREIDLLHSLWVTHDQEGEDNCSPPDEQVLTTKGYRPIGQLDPDLDRLVSYSPENQKIHRGVGNRSKENDTGYKFEKATRPYSGDLLTVKTDSSETRVTPNHKFTVRWTEKAQESWAIYLMKKGDWWRIGTTKLYRGQKRQNKSGLGMRLHHEDAEKAWIIDTFDTLKDALFNEALYSHAYGVPDWTFRSDEHGDRRLDQDDLARLWNSVNSEDGALRLLDQRGLDIRWPLMRRYSDDQEILRQSKFNCQWTTQACNLIPELMEIPTDPGEGLSPVWRPISVDREHYEGDVVSLEVLPYHHYISGGAVTQNSIYGFSRIAHAAPIYHMFWYIWTLLGRAFENNADPGPIVRYPRDEPSLLNASGDTVKNVETALTIGRRRRSGSTTALPSEPYTDYTDRPSGSVFKWGIEYPEIKTDFEALMKWIGILEATKLRALWLPEQGVIEGEGGTSSRNVASEFGSQRDESQGVLFSQIAEQVDHYLVKPAIKMNFPWFEGTIQMKALGFGQYDEDTVRQILQLAGQENWRSFGIDVQKLVEARGFPMHDPVERKRLMDEAARQAEKEQTPVVEPKQGRRAYVTQSGFGESHYVQLGGKIELAEDGDFVANLPSTIHFADKGVVAVARAMRVASRTYFQNIYNDVARHLSRRRDVPDDLDEDKALELATEILEAWTPRPERSMNFVDTTHVHLARVFDRASEVQAKNIMLSDRLHSTDADQASWLEEYSYEAVARANSDVRDDVLSFVAKELLVGTRTRELGESVRKEFARRPRSMSEEFARRETMHVYNRAVLETGDSAGLLLAQILDTGDGDRCQHSHGQVVALSDCKLEAGHDSSCTLGFRLLRARDLEVRKAQTDGRFKARFDEDTETVLFSPDITREEERVFLLALGERLAA